MEKNLIAAVRADLVDSIDEKTRDGAQRFFKEEVKFHGVKSPAVSEIAQRYFQEIKGREKGEIFSLCEDLLRSGYGEEAFIAFEWAYSIRKRFLPQDFSVFESWIQNYVDNWAKCDTVCNHTLGSFIEMYPEYIASLKAWSRSENRWLRRASAVTLILPARKGMFLSEILEISDLLLKDRDDLVQKGLGWMLKEASKRHQKEVFDYIMSRKSEMPRTALRYAIEKMPEDLKKLAMHRDVTGEISKEEPKEELEERVRRAVHEKIDIVSYDPNWPHLFTQERDHLLAILPAGIIRRIEHFGSTAVPGLAAKPIIDMLVEVTSLEETRERIVPILLASGAYEYFWRPTWGDDTLPFYAWFIKRNSLGRRTHHIHMVPGHFEHWERLNFRDYLRANPRVAEEYQRLKIRLAQEYPHDRAAYTEAKTEFIRHVMKCQSRDP